MKADDRRYINLYLDEATIKRIDDYRFENRVVSRTEAIRRLIEKALPSPRKTPKNIA